jgi:uracil-DNA glycosylase family 4
MIDESTKNRLRLWLRSERALGLPSVGPADWSVAAESAVEQESRIAAPVQRAISPPMRPAAALRPPVNVNAVSLSPAAPAPQSPASEPFTSPLLSTEERRIHLATLDESQVRSCVKCQLCHTRTKTVFGEGDSDARLMFIGEGPGSKEDQTGRPFVGPAGELLNRMIGAMGLKREQVYIANVVKCRAFMPRPPPKDRAPALEEVAACSPYLQQQVEIIRPRVSVTLGVPATQFVLQTKTSMSRMRGTWSAWHGIKVMPTWHPSYLLRREKEGDVEPKRQAWSDLQQVMKELGLASPRKSE